MRHLEPVDLSYHIRLGLNALLGGLDPKEKHMPYWQLKDYGRGDQIVAMSPPGEHRPMFPPCPE